MGACLTKEAAGGGSKKTTDSSFYAAPSIEEMYKKNKAEMRKNPKR